MTLCVESINRIQEMMRKGEEEWSSQVRRGDSYILGGLTPHQEVVPRGPYSRVVVKHYLAKTETVARSWRERLFTLPWRPWRRLKTIPGKPVYYLDRDGTIYTCPRGADELGKNILGNMGIAP